ncbi:Chemotaxis protein CheY [Rubripirellula obstinata]|uniref:Chemotaxis protein CheY n=1 Tax=Rubripirellula obstinata TaxID=406547 RepID=A0A5B1CCQ7_9BACT|nr:response regulator [Rubripirellula obstinata]KAA1258346.1 Chemotaxis protein CheY [Rubripirellula obstinata]
MADSPHLLIVDDSPTQLSHMKIILQQDGFQVETASNGEEAMAAVESDSPILVVTDLQMPGMSGLELVEVMRGNFPSIPVVLTTSDGSEEVAADALRRGAASYVPKRHLQSTLAQVVRQVLLVSEASRSVQQLARYTIESTLKLSLVNDESIVPSVIARLEMPMKELGIFDEGERMQVAMALDEALLNAMIHGNLEVSSELRHSGDGEPYKELIAKRTNESPYMDRRVLVQMDATPEQVKFTIADEGPGFDCGKVADPTDPENLEMMGGRGLFMIDAFMDEVQHNECGNQIVMIKRKKTGEESGEEG